MSKSPILATLAVALFVLAACSSAPQAARSDAPPPPPSEPTSDTRFKEALQKRIGQMPSAHVDPTRSAKSALDSLRAARDAEVAIEQELRAEFARSGTMSDEPIERLREARDARYDAIYRLIVDDPSSPLPDELWIAKGGAR